MGDGFQDLMGDHNMLEGSFIYADDAMNYFFEVVSFDLSGPNNPLLAFNGLYQFFIAL